MDLATVVLYTVVRCTSGGLGLEYQVFPVEDCKQFKADHGGLYSEAGWDHGYTMCFPAPPRFAGPKPIFSRYKDHTWGNNCGARPSANRSHGD